MSVHGANNRMVHFEGVEGVRPIFRSWGYIADWPFKPKNASDPRRVNGYPARRYLRLGIPPALARRFRGLSTRGGVARIVTFRTLVYRLRFKT